MAAVSPHVPDITSDNAFYDLERFGFGFGFRFVASPRHADVLMVTGPVTKNMREVLERTIAATPDPKCVHQIGIAGAPAGAILGLLGKCTLVG